MVKHCPGCNKLIPIDRFSKNRTRANGLAGWCKACSLQAKNKSIKKRQEYYAKQAFEYSKKYRKKFPEKVREYKRKYYYKHFERLRLRIRKYNYASRKKSDLRHPSHVKARQAIASAIRSGKLTRPKYCELCHEKAKTGRKGQSLLYGDHFMGYEKKYWLTVRFICRKCDSQNLRKYAQS